MDTIRHRLSTLEATLQSVAASLSALVRLEQHHADTRAALDRAFKAIQAQAERLEAAHTALGQRIAQVDEQVPDRLAERLERIEGRVPLWNLTTGWVLAFTVGAACLVFAAVGAMVMDRPREPTQQTTPAVPRVL
jgi:multidrug resistance efflux pump